MSPRYVDEASHQLSTTIPNWLETKSRWDLLRAMGNSSIVRSAVFMPAFGYILLWNEKLHGYLTVKYDEWLLHYLHLPSVWRIWFVFYGTFALAIATLLYSALCPRSIKRFDSAADMADKEAVFTARVSGVKDVAWRLGIRIRDMSRWERQIYPIQLAEWEVENHRTDHVNLTREYLANTWTLENIKHPFTRVFILFLYSVGLALLAAPAIVTFVQVTLVALRKLAALIF